MPRVLAFFTTTPELMEGAHEHILGALNPNGGATAICDPSRTVPWSRLMFRDPDIGVGLCSECLDVWPKENLGGGAPRTQPDIAEKEAKGGPRKRSACRAEWQFGDDVHCCDKDEGHVGDPTNAFHRCRSASHPNVTAYLKETGESWCVVGSVESAFQAAEWSRLVGVGKRGVRRGGELTFDEMVAACRNIGFDLTCGACAGVFYTGYSMGEAHDLHCGTVDVPPPGRVVSG